ncbi:MAG: formyltransferase [Alphaproteobacteria bacterium]|nr:formyltransferase [Alphaproteobacteria bacterium]
MTSLVFAYSQLGHDCLKILIDQGEKIVGVITHENSATESIWFDSVADLARQRSIPVFTPANPNTPEMIQLIRQMQPDLIFSFYYRQMISDGIIGIPRLGAFNMHGSLLPKYRGRCPVNWAMIHGEARTGATLHYMVKKADAGDIVDQESVPIDITDTAGIVMEKINQAAQKIVMRQLPQLRAGTAPRVVQDEKDATYFGGRCAEDGKIDWTMGAWQIYNLIRALQPSPQYPPAFAEIEGEAVTVLKSQIPTNGIFEPRPVGEVTHRSGAGTEIACGPRGMERIVLVDYKLFS